MDDAMREKIIKKLYHVFDIGGDTMENCTEDEFVRRVFRDLTSEIHLVDGGETITKEVFGLFWKEIVALVDFCKDNKLQLNLNGSKNNQEFWIEIEPDDGVSGG